MEWRDQAYILGVRRHAETALVVDLLTRSRGRHAGLVRGGQSPRHRAVLQPGNEVEAIWRARLSDHLGMLGCELVHAHAARFLSDGDRLAALASAAALLSLVLPEREPAPDMFDAFGALLETLGHTPAWPAFYVEWEQGLLAALGFGLDLRCCAATGSTEDLAYVSPRTGRAVSREAGHPYRDRLLALPAFLWRGTAPDAQEIILGLTLTGYFLRAHLLQPLARELPEIRIRLIERLRRADAAVLTA